MTDNPKDVARMLKKDGKDLDIRIGDLPIIRDSEIELISAWHGQEPVSQVSVVWTTMPVSAVIWW